MHMESGMFIRSLYACWLLSFVSLLATTYMFLGTSSHNLICLFTAIFASGVSSIALGIIISKIKKAR